MDVIYEIKRGKTVGVNTFSFDLELVEDDALKVTRIPKV